ncbi:hypothetical protein FJY84_06335 [Candidatus Bathyarchaeota archaeon]|nr:hypothetical protein [Candidatus Bathyarchaeota archaeon]
MSNYPLLEARRDVIACIQVWKKLFETFYSNILDYAYVKGSAVKKWDSAIDYVPMLSDVDIHFKIKDGANFFSSENKFREAIKINELYEKKFVNKNPNYLHIPRIQVLELNSRLNNLDFVLTSELHNEDILFGNPEKILKREVNEIRTLDLKMLLNLQELLNNLPMSVLDRSGIDFITLIRRLSYEVSPSPVRVLSQILDDPYEVWNLNRTDICKKLLECGFTDLAKSYSGYYFTGWDVFRTSFRDTALMRSLLLYGYEVLSKSFNYGKQINQKNT